MLNLNNKSILITGEIEENTIKYAASILILRKDSLKCGIGQKNKK